MELIATSLKQAGVTKARILEVGSGTHPPTAWLTDHEVLALDISSPLLELGALYFADRFTDRLGFLCADAFKDAGSKKCETYKRHRSDIEL